VNQDRRAVDPVALDAMLDLVGGDIEFLDELVDTFLDDAIAQLGAMRLAAQSDLDGLVRPAHSMKTNSANLGATVLAQMCRDLEADARSGSVNGAAERVAAAEAEFEAVRTDLLALRAARV
jgi:HPt (histidine-containing phosphotransfer) domain-containing protein